MSGKHPPVLGVIFLFSICCWQSILTQGRLFHGTIFPRIKHTKSSRSCPDRTGGPEADNAHGQFPLYITREVCVHFFIFWKRDKVNTRSILYQSQCNTMTSIKIIIISILFVLLGIGVTCGVIGCSGGDGGSSKEKVAGPSPVTEPSPAENLTANWQTFSNKEFGFEFKYPPDWFVDENAPDLVKEDIIVIRTRKYREEKISEESSGKEKIVKVYDGEIFISFYPDAFVTQQCQYSEETLQLTSGSWRACLSLPEGFSVPKLSIQSLTPGYSLTFSGGLETEKYVTDIHRVSDYDFMILSVIKTFHFTK